MKIFISYLEIPADLHSSGTVVPQPELQTASKQENEYTILH
jgi:hypothetical protein